MNKLFDTILDEQRFPYEGMNIEQRNYYLNIIRNCKDIKDSEHKIDGESVCQILELSFKKKDSHVAINGLLSIGTDNVRENRCIEGLIFMESNNVIVDYHITRLCVGSVPTEYTVLDEFKLCDGKLMRNSFYNYDMKKIETEIDDEIMKGRLK